jgi:hypothetical protein
MSRSLNATHRCVNELRKNKTALGISDFRLLIANLIATRQSTINNQQSAISTQQSHSTIANRQSPIGNQKSRSPGGSIK